MQVALNQARYNEKLIAEARANELSEGVAIYRGIEPKTGRALIQPLGGTSAIPIGRLITNGAIKLGQRVQLTRHDTDTYFADALPHSGGGGGNATQDALDNLLPSRGGSGGIVGRAPIGYNNVDGSCTPVFSGTPQFGSLEECTAGQTGATCQEISTAIGGSLSYSAPAGKVIQSVRQLEGNAESCAPAVVSSDRRSLSGGGSASAACGYDVCTLDAEKKWICQNGQCLEVTDSGTYTSKAECEAALVPAPFAGGQCSTKYWVEVEVTGSPAYSVLHWGPIGGAGKASCPDGTSFYILSHGLAGQSSSDVRCGVDGNSYDTPLPNQIQATAYANSSDPNATAAITILSVTRQDGQPDDCGSPPPTCP